MRRPPRALVVAVVALSGCSFISMKRPPDPVERGQPVDCTSTLTMPLVDFGLAVMSGSAAVLFHSAASDEDDKPDGDPTAFRIATWTSIGLAIGFIVSGAYGSLTRSRCRNAQIEAGIPMSTTPNIDEEGRPAAGGVGGACKEDKDCSGGLVCDEPMHTCIEPVAPPETPAPETAPP